MLFEYTHQQYFVPRAIRGFAGVGSTVDGMVFSGGRTVGIIIILYWYRIMRINYFLTAIQIVLEFRLSILLIN